MSQCKNQQGEMLGRAFLPVCRAAVIICQKFSDMRTNCELQITCCGHELGEDYWESIGSFSED